MENSIYVDEKKCKALIKHLKKGGGEIFAGDLGEGPIAREIHIYAYWDIDGVSDDSVLIQLSFTENKKISFIAWGVREAVEIIFSIYRADGRNILLSN